MSYIYIQHVFISEQLLRTFPEIKNHTKISRTFDQSKRRDGAREEKQSVVNRWRKESDRDWKS